jgi:hypothetical protein
MTEIDASRLSIYRVRGAIRNQMLSFPAQAPLFSRHSKPDREWRMAVLYFIHGWQCRDLARRFEITPVRVRQILGEWKRRAVQVGFIQSIPPDQPMKKPERIPKESVKAEQIPTS